MITLNRRVRRIGLLPTTFKEIPDGERKVKTADGESMERATKKVPIRHSEPLTHDDREVIAANLRTANRERHLTFRASRKAGTTHQKVA